MNKVILLSGPPNVGKSSIFNILTGMNQHTGNWSGKTVSISDGICKFDNSYKLVDLPGTYSLMHSSEEELVARDSILFSTYYKNVIVSDVCSLERNLNLILQILEANNNCVLVLNQYDLAVKKGINIDVSKLSSILGIDVVLCSAKNKEGISDVVKSFESLKRSSYRICYGDLESRINELSKVIDSLNLDINSRFVSLKLLQGDFSISDSILSKYDINILDFVDLSVDDFDNNIDVISFEINRCSKEIYDSVISDSCISEALKFDRLISKKSFGIPFVLLMLAVVFYITIVFANYPSNMLSESFDFLGNKLIHFCSYFNVPTFIYEPLILGMYKTLTWVVSVMLPPMAIFFPLFALLEESGLLPRLAFNFDYVFKKCGAHGKQMLTTLMGFGCNACAVASCRIIDSPRDKLVAILTNSFIPCNGRFPLLIAIISMFFASSGIIAALILTFLILLGIFMSLIVSKVLSKTILKGVSSYFVLELPSYKKPKICSVIVRSIFDKTLFVLFRAVKVALPAGLIIWLIANINIFGDSLLNHIALFLDPFASIIGVDGIILLAFILALPANEIVLPIILMGYLASGEMVEMSSLSSLKELLVNNGWTFMTALSVCILSIMHFPCATTLLTIKKEAGFKWMVYAFIIPTICGILFLSILNLIF